MQGSQGHNSSSTQLQGRIKRQRSAGGILCVGNHGVRCLSKAAHVGPGTLHTIRAQVYPLLMLSNYDAEQLIPVVAPSSMPLSIPFTLPACNPMTTCLLIIPFFLQYPFHCSPSLSPSHSFLLTAPALTLDRPPSTAEAAAAADAVAAAAARADRPAFGRRLRPACAAVAGAATAWPAAPVLPLGPARHTSLPVEQHTVPSSPSSYSTWRQDKSRRKKTERCCVRARAACQGR